MSPQRRVLIGTPCYDGRADVWYINSLMQTQRMSTEMGVEIIPIWLSYDALVQRARNDCIALALENNCDDIVFIDSDLEWQPEWFFQLLDYPVDVVGGTYRKKTDDEETYVAKFSTPIRYHKDPNTGLVEVEGLGTGFLRISRSAMQWLWDNSPAYNEHEEGKLRRWIFEVVVENGNLISEDILLCRRLREAGFPIWLDPSMTLSHMGTKKFQGNFEQWISRLAAPASASEPLPKKSLKDLYR
jgi:glycosyltransferase involved in cell wall biosynthesis